MTSNTFDFGARAASASYDVEPRLEERRPADRERLVPSGAVRCPPPRQRRQLAVPVADVEDRDFA